MKKIVSTLTAIALSIVMVSTIDARARTQKGGGKKTTARIMNDDAKALADNNTPQEEKKDAAAELMELFKKNPNEFELAQLYVQLKQKQNEIDAKKSEIKAMNVGWFDFSNVDYKEAKAKLSVLNTQKAEITSKINAQVKVVGPEESNAVRNAVYAIIVVGGLGLADWYFETGILSGAMTKVGEGMEYMKKTYRKYAPTSLGGDKPLGRLERAQQRAGELYETGKEKASAAWEAGKEKVRGIYERSELTAEALDYP